MPPRSPKVWLATGSLLLVGAVCGLLSIALATTTVEPERRVGQVLLAIAWGVAAPVQILAGVLVFRGRPFGGWLAVGGAMATLAIAIVSLIGTALPDQASFGLVVLAALHLRSLFRILPQVPDASPAPPTKPMRPRAAVLTELVRDPSTARALEDELDAYARERLGTPLVTLSRDDIRYALESGVAGRSHFRDVHEWARVVEFRDDIGFEDAAVAGIVHEIAGHDSALPMDAYEANLILERLSKAED